MGSKGRKIGIDIGALFLKAVRTDATGQILATFYKRHKGEPGKVLEEALGFPQIVFVPRGKARGGLIAYYDFKQDMENRLTDEQWRQILADLQKMKELELSPGSVKYGGKR